jgi:hypothetical protein
VDISLSLADTLRVGAITLADVGAELARGGAVRGFRLLHNVHNLSSGRQQLQVHV